jgi:hypothetical protein
MKPPEEVIVEATFWGSLVEQGNVIFLIANGFLVR